MSVYIIAEAGVNHNGRPEIAKAMIDAAKEAGADCIKFQTFKSGHLVSKHAKKADYQIKQPGESENQLQMLQKLELSRDAFIDLYAYCCQKQIDFMSTPFDEDSIDFLHSLKMDRWKIPSGEITNLPYLLKIASFQMPVILSTGMCTMDEIRTAVDMFRTKGCFDITLLHCTTDYPASFKDVNLKALITLKEEFQVRTGYSDHTRGIEIPIAAAAIGATIIEKHFTLDRNMVGPDHMASLEPQELMDMVKAIRNVELAMGSGIKEPVASELKNLFLVRKSIVARRNITKGETLTSENLTVKRPGNGISPMNWFDILGQKAVRDFEEDELIEC